MIVAEPVGSCTDLMATVVLPLERIYDQPFALSPLSVVLDARRAPASLGGKKSAREALEDSESARFVLVSESCVPVRPFKALANSLRMDTRSRINVTPWEEVRRRDVL